MVSAEEANDGYRAVCAAALSGLASVRHEENGEVLLTREEPGLVTLIGLVVQAARKVPVLVRSMIPNPPSPFVIVPPKEAFVLLLPSVKPISPGKLLVTVPLDPVRLPTVRR